MSKCKGLYISILFALFIQAKSQILNGTVAEPRKLKYLVQINPGVRYKGNNGEWIYKGNTAAGTIVKYHWVLTNAHVIRDSFEHHEEYEKIFVLTAGTKNVSELTDAQQRTVRKSDAYVHRDYDGLIANDVALIYLKKPFEISETVEPTKLLTSEQMQRKSGQAAGALFLGGERVV